jgi:hypothetical protein
MTRQRTPQEVLTISLMTEPLCSLGYIKNLWSNCKTDCKTSSGPWATAEKGKWSRRNILLDPIARFKVFDKIASFDPVILVYIDETAGSANKFAAAFYRSNVTKILL